MKRLNGMTPTEIRAYNMRGNGNEFTIFAESQPFRVEKAREMVAALLPPAPATIVELGCSAGDICGFFSAEHNVMGVEPVPGAAHEAEKRWPSLFVNHSWVEDVEPVETDVLILCEFLEHIPDPIDVVERWGTKAKAMVIGHPLYDRPGIEPGHLWSYEDDDYANWYRIAGMTMGEAFTFSMGPFPKMIIGSGKR